MQSKDAPCSEKDPPALGASVCDARSGRIGKGIQVRLGNSIALPPWRWILKRVSAFLPTDATLGSLFDGIGGFPLLWEENHPAGSARWASEIEAFSIAVTEQQINKKLPIS